jgi:hypothetical protein
MIIVDGMKLIADDNSWILFKKYDTDIYTEANSIGRQMNSPE